jgi:hypothetical protein
MTTLCFPLIVALPAPGMGSRILSGPSMSGPSAPPMELPERSALAERPPEEPSESAKTPVNSTRSGSFYYDRVCGRYPMEWARPAEFEAWCREEELAYSIELIPSNTVHRGKLWTLKWTYVCSRQLSGGPKKYQKKFLDWQQKIESKKTGCWCRIVIKSYPHTSAILGCYVSEHDHETGLANITYTRMLWVACEKIKYKLVQKIDPREIVRMRTLILVADLIQSQARDIWDSAPDGSQDQFISLQDVCRMAHVVEEEDIRLHEEDGISTKLWVDRLKATNIDSFYKDKLDPPPSGSRLQGDAIILCIPTTFQADAFRCLGNGFIGIDATHNITQYRDFLLFTIVARDRWGHSA